MARSAPRWGTCCPTHPGARPGHHPTPGPGRGAPGPAPSVPAAAPEAPPPARSPGPSPPLAQSQSNLSPIQVDVLDPEGEAIQQPKTASLPEHPGQPLGSAQLAQHPTDLVQRQHHRQPDRHPGTRNNVADRLRPPEDLAVRELERRQGLDECRRRHPAIDCQMTQESSDLGRGSASSVLGLKCRRRRLARIRFKSFCLGREGAGRGWSTVSFPVGFRQV